MERSSTLDLGEPIAIVPAEGSLEARAEVERAVRRKASGLVRAAAERIPGFGEPPFDPRRLARALGVPIHFTPRLGEVDALIVHRGGAFHILANSNVRNVRRLNFTLAHEIGHLFFAGAEREVHLRARDRRVYERSPEGRVLERMCDLAAAELLMPSGWFEGVVEEVGFNAAAVPRVAERFEVSLEAGAVRMLGMREDEAWAVGFFEYGVRPSVRTGRRGSGGGGRRGNERRHLGGSARGAGGPGRDRGVDDVRYEDTRYRVRRAFRTRSFPFLFPEGKSVSSESVVYRCSLGRQMLEAREWFSLGRTRAEVQVSAWPLHREEAVEEPPMVCGVFGVG